MTGFKLTTAAETPEEHYDEIDMLRVARETTLDDFAAWQVVELADGEEIAVVEDRNEANELAATLECGGVYGVLEDDPAYERL